MAETDDFVVCVDDTPGFGGASSRLSRGTVYTVTQVVGNGHGLLVAEATLPAEFDGWRADRFRLVEPKALDIFHAVEARTPALQEP